MENQNKMVATLPDYEEDVPMSDEERDVDDMVLVPLTDIELAPNCCTGTNVDAAATHNEPALALCAAVIQPETAMQPTTGMSSATTTPRRGITPGGSDRRSDGKDPVATPKSTAGSTGSSKRRCSWCHQKHHLRQCGRFKRLSLDKKIRTVVKHLCCSNCLDSDHLLRDCRKDPGCKQCKGKHHNLLHPSAQLSQQNNNNNKNNYNKDNKNNKNANNKNTNNNINKNNINNNGPSTSSRSNKRPSVQSTPSAFSSHVTTLHSMAIQPIITIGPTIVAQLVSHTKIIPVRAMLDPCAGSSQICNSLVKSLRLNTTPVGSDRFAQFTLVSTFDSAQRLLVSARVTNLTHRLSPNQSASESIKEHYQGMMLADPQFFKSSRVAVVLGAEVYPKVMKTQVYSSPGFPWAQLTIFGWVLSGPCPM
ncbi:GATOR complex protein WDR24-like [Musca domestica]|uniref:GATOR complex protein WDR24-like n=1 Tax=Musca domestica TaxID=7370 RepID=A0ABM3UYW7_MUSDO|nr:GATOR complex protein WDR24-like [Musca domestica]